MESGTEHTIELKDYKREREMYKTQCAHNKSSRNSLVISNICITDLKINTIQRDQGKSLNSNEEETGKENPNNNKVKSFRIFKEKSVRAIKSVNDPKQFLAIIQKSSGSKHAKKPSLLFPEPRKMHRATVSQYKFTKTQRHRKNLSEYEQKLINRLAGIK